MNFVSLTQELLYFLIFSISLLSLIAISLFVKSDENASNYKVTSWTTLGLDCFLIVVSGSLFKITKRNKQQETEKVCIRQFVLLGAMMLQIISTTLASNASPWGAYATSGLVTDNKGQFFYTLFVIITNFYPYLVLMLLLTILQNKNSFTTLKQFGMVWLISWSVFDFIACAVSIKSFFIYQYAIPDFKIVIGFLLVFNLLQMASAVSFLIKQNNYLLISTLIIAIAQFVCVSILSYMLPTLAYFLNSSEWTYLEVANYSSYGVLPVMIFLLILFFFYHNADEEADEEADTHKSTFFSKLLSLIIVLIAAFLFFSISIYLGLYNSVSNSNQLWDFPYYDSTYKGYCGSIIAVCLTLIGFAVILIIDPSNKVKITSMIGILLASCGCVALITMKQGSAFEQNIWGIFSDYAAQLEQYPKWYQTGKERSFLHTWDYTNEMGIISIAIYTSIYLWIILYLTKRLSASSILRNALYIFQFLIGSISLIAFALLYSKIGHYLDNQYKAIMLFLMIFVGFLTLITVEHFLISKSSSQIVSIETIIMALSILFLSVLQATEEPSLPFLENYYNFTYVMRNLLVSFLPLQLISEITHLIKEDELEFEGKLDAEKENFLQN